MAELRKATIDLFPDILPLLEHFDVPDMGSEDWFHLFSASWKGKRDYFGYVLMEGRKAVGFLGGLFHERLFEEDRYPVCNLFCWYVLEEFRSQSLLLLMPFLREKGLTVTSLTPSREASLVLKKFNFTVLESSVMILPMLPFGWASLGYEMLSEPGLVSLVLSPGDKILLKDHSPHWCRHILLWNGEKSGEYCLILFNKVRKRGVNFTQVYHVSNVGLFLRNLGRIQRRFFILNKTFFTVVDRRLLKGHRAFGGFSYELRYPRLMCSEDIRPEIVDNLYSELVFLKKI